MFEQAFYYQSIKKSIIGFGALFSNIKAVRRNEDGTTTELVKVPIAYGPKEKFIVRLDAEPELDVSNGVMITLPRLGFEITGYQYDGAAMTNRNNKIQCRTATDGAFTYTPVPYNIDIEMYLLTKGTEDSLQILEQILPLFTPEYTMTVNAVPAMNINIDVPIQLNGVSVSDDYEGDMATKRLVTHTFSFTMKTKIIGPINHSGVILRTETLLPEFTSQHVSEGDRATGDVTMDNWNNI